MSLSLRSSNDPRPVPGPALRLARLGPWRQRLSDESGVALFVVLAVLVVVTVMVTSALAYTSSNSRDAYRGTATQKAYAAAEAGLNDGVSAVRSAGSDTSAMPSYPAITGLPAPTVTNLSATVSVT